MLSTLDVFFQYFQQLVNATGSLVSSGFHNAREKYICARHINLLCFN
jgi:hypothetical protein